MPRGVSAAGLRGYRSVNFRQDLGAAAKSKGNTLENHVDPRTYVRPSIFRAGERAREPICQVSTVVYRCDAMFAIATGFRKSTATFAVEARISSLLAQGTWAGRLGLLALLKSRGCKIEQLREAPAAQATRDGTDHSVLCRGVRRGERLRRWLAQPPLHERPYPLGQQTLQMPRKAKSRLDICAP